MTKQTAASEAVWLELEKHQNSECTCVTVDECHAAQIAIMDSFARIEVLRGRLDEHKLTCHKALLQYDEKMRLVGNLRCGEGWECERRTDLQAQLKEAEEGR